MGNRYTALIVSSDQHNIERLSDILKDSYNIITAGNGIDALEIMRGDSRPDIAVVDESEYEDDVARGLNEDSTLFSVPVVFVVSDDDIVNRVSNSETVDFAPVGNPAAVRRHVFRRILSAARLSWRSRIHAVVASARLSARNVPRHLLFPAPCGAGQDFVRLFPVAAYYPH